MCRLTALEELRMNQNRLRGLPPDLGRLGRLADLQALPSRTRRAARARPGCVRAVPSGGANAGAACRLLSLALPPPAGKI